MLDTNVLASGIVGLDLSSAPPAEIFRRWQARTFGLVTSDDILDELVRTLASPYFAQRVLRSDAESTLSTLQVYAEIVVLSSTVEPLATHPEDDLVLATAISARADYLVTGDRQLLALQNVYGVAIVNARRFVAILNAAG